MISVYKHFFKFSVQESNGGYRRRSAISVAAVPAGLGGQEEDPTPASWPRILRNARYGREYTGCMQVSRLTLYSAYDYVSILSMDLQKCLAERVAALERATELANEMSLFSDNKDLVDLATASHK